MFELLQVTGPEAETFLQGQLTQDLALLQRAGALPAAWCNPKGRVIVSMLVARRDDGIALLLPAATTENVVKRLTMYRLRAKVTFEAQPELPRGDTLAQLADAGFSGDWLGAGDNEGARIALLRRGFAVIDAANTERYTPHMLSLDLAGAISFDKGCYTGQEIVARTEHRGASRRRLQRYRLGAPGAIGDSLQHEGNDVGELVNVVDNEALAVIPDAVRDETLTIHGTSAAPLGLPWDKTGIDAT